MQTEFSFSFFNNWLYTSGHTKVDQFPSSHQPHVEKRGQINENKISKMFSIALANGEPVLAQARTPYSEHFQSEGTFWNFFSIEKKKSTLKKLDFFSTISNLRNICDNLSDQNSPRSERTSYVNTGSPFADPFQVSLQNIEEKKLIFFLHRSERPATLAVLCCVTVSFTLPTFANNFAIISGRVSPCRYPSSNPRTRPKNLSTCSDVPHASRRKPR